MSKKKKIIILSCMIALLAATAAVNFLLSGTKTEDAVTVANYFTQYRTERSSSRNEQILRLDAIISEAETDSAALNDALEMKLQLTAIMEKELLLENLIKAQGYEDAVVTISTANVNVIVKKNGEVDATDAAQILSIVTAETGVTASKVIITPYSV